MAAGRPQRSLVGRRRRVDEEGEEDEGPVLVNDSQSEGSILSDIDEDDATSLGGSLAPSGNATGDGLLESASSNSPKVVKKARKKKEGKASGKEEAATKDDDVEPVEANFAVMADTDAMMNGLRIEEGADEPAVDFETMEHPEAVSASAPKSAARQNGVQETPAQRQRREHEEYKKKRDADPAFTPNRGNFFMHDTRGQQNGQSPNIMRGGFMGRGRGQGGMPLAPVNHIQPADRPAEQTWKHDLHETINEEVAPVVTKDTQQQSESARLFPRPSASQMPTQPRTINFSSTTLVGRVQIRVLLPGMKAPIPFSEVPWKHYVRLPNHRPPLRRDKPVRVSLPNKSPQYIFPSAERAFIFIPRQQRPSQYGPSHGQHQRGSYQRNAGGQGYSSRRTSMYGGSVYASSVAASRRSSMAGVNRADAFSPASFASGVPPSNRPMVRMPHQSQQGYQMQHHPQQQYSGITTPLGPRTPLPQMHMYPLPQKPAFQGTPTSSLHQPRPQKVISVDAVERSPAVLQQVPSHESHSAHGGMPFESQLPANMNPTPSSGWSADVFHSQQPQPTYSFEPGQGYTWPHAQQQAGTPLTGIPEQAIHAPAFHPPPPQMGYGQPSPYFQQQYPPMQQPQQFYYPTPDGAEGYGAPMGMGMSVPYMPPAMQQGYGRMSSPSQQPPYQHFTQDQSFPSALPNDPLQAPPPSDDSPQRQETESVMSSSGMLAREKNGMVFYVPKSDVPAEHSGTAENSTAAQAHPQQQQSQPRAFYQPAENFVPSYAMPPGMSGMSGSGAMHMNTMSEQNYLSGLQAGQQNWYYPAQALQQQQQEDHGGIGVPMGGGMGASMGMQGAQDLYY
ncbi:hypothetical protein LTR62_006769 [Meristemomyces frigidus]|uniref:Btz domain-containing protein n=1 Tax=Meristemomyces frigidus TaxID=1508187 RepID=A0AAN7YTD7_9PEZI|nr:hypothetical protein LTR62_006769 [Meristemomyces frigidus]